MGIATLWYTIMILGPIMVVLIAVAAVQVLFLLMLQSPHYRARLFLLLTAACILLYLIVPNYIQLYFAFGDCYHRCDLDLFSHTPNSQQALVDVTQRNLGFVIVYLSSSVAYCILIVVAIKVMFESAKLKIRTIL